MEKKTVGIIATAVTALCCGCPGLFSLCWGALAALVSFMPGADINIGGSKDPQSALITGVGAFCFGILFIAIPIVIGFFVLRKKPVTKDSSSDQPPATI